MDRAYYDEFVRLEREHWWFRARSEILSVHVQSLTRTDKPAILNVGSATGGSSEMLSAHGRVTSVEYDLATCHLAYERTGVPVINGTGTALPFADSSFDIVCAFDVLEHIEDHAAAAAELKRVCRKGGAVCVTVPAFMLLWSHHDEVIHHHRRYRPAALRRLFEGEDGRVIFATCFTSLLFPAVAAFRILSRALPPRLVRRGAGTDFTVPSRPALDRLLHRLMLVDRALVRRRLPVPVGVSAMLSWRKA